MPNGQRRAPQPPKSKTVQFRKWRGVNRTDARVAIEDDELSWMENALTIGNGAIQILPARAAAVATIGAGVHSLWGFTLDGNPVLISVNTDGSMSQITPGGVVTAVAPAGAVTTSARPTIWRGSPILILDPTTGYLSWDGSALTTIDAARTGTAIASFAGRVWFASGRTIAFTAPNTNNDFAVGNGAGSTILTDSAFPGNIVTLVSAVEQLWILGQGAIEALSNVAASGTPPNVVTTFTVTNILVNLGTNARSSVIGYFRALAFLAPFGVYALAGVTPQKLSDKLDGLLPDLTLTPDAPAAVAVVENLLCLLLLTTYNGTLAQAGAAPQPILLGFTQGKWFFGAQGTALRWITTLLVNGVAQAWGTDGSTIYRLFGAPATTAVPYKVQSKLYDFGLATTEHAAVKLGLELSALNTIAPTVTVDSEVGSESVPLSPSGAVTFLNTAGAVIILINAAGEVITFVSQAMLLSRERANQYGHYLGWTISGTDPPYRIQAVQMEVAASREWSTP